MMEKTKDKKDYRSCLCMFSTCEDCGARINLIEFGKRVRADTIREVLEDMRDITLKDTAESYSFRLKKKQESKLK